MLILYVHLCMLCVWKLFPLRSAPSVILFICLSLGCVCLCVYACIHVWVCAFFIRVFVCMSVCILHYDICKLYVSMKFRCRCVVLFLSFGIFTLRVCTSLFFSECTSVMCLFAWMCTTCMCLCAPDSSYTCVLRVMRAFVCVPRSTSVFCVVVYLASLVDGSEEDPVLLAVSLSVLPHAAATPINTSINTRSQMEIILSPCRCF